MNRRGANPQSPLLARVAALLVAVTIVVAGPAVGITTAAGDDPPADSPPPTTVDDFFPEERNLSDCLGTLERPGCGSKSRGGWRQTLTFAVMAGGLVVVFGRIAWAVRKSSKARAGSG